jgi:hypothetical protein
LNVTKEHSLACGSPGPDPDPDLLNSIWWTRFLDLNNLADPANVACLVEAFLELLVMLNG